MNTHVIPKASAASCSRRDFYLIGKVLQRENPEIFQRLRAAYIDVKAIPPLESDHEQIPLFFSRFCFFLGLVKEDYTGPLSKSSKVDVRRHFIATMLHLYCPHVYYQPVKDIELPKNGFVKALAQTLQQNASNISLMIREVILWEKEYEDFRDKVEEAVEKLKA